MKRVVFVLACAVLIGCLCAAAALAATQGSFAAKVEAAYLAKKPYPLASQEIPNLTPEQAYAIQREFVALRTKKGETVIGYKAGLTAEPAQKKFGMNEPVFGTIFTSMVRRPGALRAKDFAKMFIETEIGFRFGKDIVKPVKDIEELKGAVAIVFPAIELPDVAYTDMKAIKGTDLIASNVAARKVLIGKAVPFRKRDLNAVKVTLTLDGKEVTSGVGKNALGDQWEALKWTVNNVLAMGGEIKAGHIVITGAISQMVPASAGTYKADYGDFGTIEFQYK
jgi:2-keto-4-pentenoate hydratase